MGRGEIPIEPGDSWFSSKSVSYTHLDVYKRQLLDRFGEPGKAVLNLLAIAKLKAIAHQGYVTEIKQTGKKVRFTLYEKARLNTEGLSLIHIYLTILQGKPDNI